MCRDKAHFKAKNMLKFFATFRARSRALPFYVYKVLTALKYALITS